MVKKSPIRASAEAAFQRWKPHQLYHKGKGQYDAVFRFGNINKAHVVTKDGAIIAEIKKGYATINGVRQPLWKVLGYKSKPAFFKADDDQLVHQFTSETFGRGR